MCSLFGIIDYGKKLNKEEINKIISVLSEECEIRGTDATGIAYSCKDKLKVYKKPIPAHEMKFNIPSNVHVVMGHTRFTTQGIAKNNYNNHPFVGNSRKREFALAHNGILYNENILRKKYKLPKTKIKTDTYIAVQLIERIGELNFDTLKEVAENVDGYFTFTLIDDKDSTYIVKGESPLVIYNFPEEEYYLYASTEGILNSAIKKLKIKHKKDIAINCGDILKIDQNGKIEQSQYTPKDWYNEITEPRFYQYGSAYEVLSYMQVLISFANTMGITEEEIYMLMDYGYMEYDIEELLCDSILLREIIDTIKIEFGEEGEVIENGGDLLLYI